MNQLELNTMAMRFIQMQSTEVAAKLNQVLGDDAQERAKLVSGPPLHYIHNMAIFDCFAALNPMFLVDDDSPEALRQYIMYAETLRPKFIELMEELKDFRPEEQNRADDKRKA
jgi:hypothetical protein